MTEMELSWVAGLFDGEGCVRLHIDKENSGSKRLRISLIAMLGMVHKPTITRLRDLVNVGNVYVKNGRNGLRKQFVWRAVSSEAKVFLESILPYSVTKREQIEMAIHAQDVIESTRCHGRPGRPENVKGHLRLLAADLAAEKRVSYN